MFDHAGLTLTWLVPLVTQLASTPSTWKGTQHYSKGNISQPPQLRRCMMFTMVDSTNLLHTVSP